MFTAVCHDAMPRRSPWVPVGPADKHRQCSAWSPPDSAIPRVGSVVFRLQMEVPRRDGVCSRCVCTGGASRVARSVRGLGCMDTAPRVGLATHAHQACHLLEDTELTLLFYRMGFIA